MSNIASGPLVVFSDALSLKGGVCMTPAARGLVVFLHGIPSTAPPDPDDPGYPGLARVFAERGWNGTWADLRGKRGSEGYFSIEGWVRDAKALIDTAGALEANEGLPVVLVASSAGGAVGVEVARRFGGVAALALLAVPAEWQGFAGDPIEGARRVQEDAGMPIPPQAVADPTQWAAEFERVTTIDSLPHVQVPVLIVHGTGDFVVPVNHARQLHEVATDSELHILDDAPHQLRRVPGAIDLVLGWLERVVVSRDRV